MAEKTPKEDSSKKGYRLTGITTAARILGVHRNHLHSVLKGERTSKKLIAKVEAQFPSLLNAYAFKK
jgi:hypothetical protein